MAGDIRMALDVCRRAVEVVEMEAKKKSKLEFGGLFIAPHETWVCLKPK